jgi:hypothetical protein
MTRSARWMAAALALAAFAVLTGCGGSSSASGPARPACNAQLQILSPQPNATVGPTPTLKFNLIGGTVVSATTGPISCAQGHIHVSVDNQLVSMAYGLTQTLPAPLTPGPHSLQAEYVAIDHKPFGTRVINKLLFQVKAA